MEIISCFTTIKAECEGSWRVETGLALLINYPYDCHRFNFTLTQVSNALLGPRDHRSCSFQRTELLEDSKLNNGIPDDGIFFQWSD